MISQVESGKPLIEIDASNKIFSSFHKAKDFLNQAADTFQATTQQAKASLTETTDKAVERASAIAQQATASVGENVEQTKESLGQIKSTTSEALQIAIASSVSDWLQAHPNILRLFQILDWAVDRPILSLVILLFTMAIAWSLIRSIGRLFEIAWLSILQAPFKLGKFLIRFCSQLIGKFGSLITTKISGNQNSELADVLSSAPEAIHQHNQQRLLEISTRLEALKQEQDELLREAIALLNSENIKSDLIPNRHHQQLFSDKNEQLLQLPVPKQDNEVIYE